MEYELEIYGKAKAESLSFLLQPDRSWRTEWEGHVLRLDMQDAESQALWAVYVDGLLVRELDSLPDNWDWQGKPPSVRLPQMPLGGMLLRPFSLLRIIVVAVICFLIARSCAN